MTDATYSQEPTPPDTEVVESLAWCPDCQAPPKSDFAHVAYCYTHQPARDGELDKMVDASSYLFNSEAGGDDNRHACAFLHRGRKET